jgi:hypothetical protein
MKNYFYTLVKTIFMTPGFWTQGLVPASILSLEPHTHPFFPLIFFSERISLFLSSDLRLWTSYLSASWIAGIKVCAITHDLFFEIESHYLFTQTSLRPLSSFVCLPSSWDYMCDLPPHWALEKNFETSQNIAFGYISETEHREIQMEDLILTFKMYF